jgi:predicted Zn-dependent protease
MNPLPVILPRQTVAPEFNVGVTTQRCGPRLGLVGKIALQSQAISGKTTRDQTIQPKKMSTFAIRAGC